MGLNAVFLKGFPRMDKKIWARGRIIRQYTIQILKMKTLNTAFKQVEF
jgi:hypothetical protein